MPRLTRRELLAGAIVPGLTACSSAHAPQDASTITVLYHGEDETAFGPADNMPASFLVFTPLVAWNRSGELEGRLAESWRHSADGRSCTIRLRDGVRWHDGMPVTAHDMKFTLDLLQNPETLQFAPDSYTVTVLDDRTYTVTFHHRNLTNEGGALDDYVACWPKHLLEKLDPKHINTWDFWNHPVGCGPYRHVRTVPKAMMEFEANRDYFRGKPKVARVILKFGTSSVVPELMSGNVDAVCYPPRGALFNVSRDRRFRVHQQIVPAGRCIFWNVGHRFFRDAATRQALTYAINRRELLQVLNLPREAHPIDFVPTDRQARRGTFPEPNPHDPEAAGLLLNQAGWSFRSGKQLRERAGESFRFKALVLSTIEGVLDSAVYVQDQLRRIGVHMDIITISDGSLVSSRIKSGEFEAAIAGLGTWELEAYLRSTGYDNQIFFELLERTRSTFDPEEYEQLHGELSAIFRADVPLTFLFPYAVTTIASARIRGLDNSPYRGDLTQCMDDLWLEEQS